MLNRITTHIIACLKIHRFCNTFANRAQISKIWVVNRLIPEIVFVSSTFIYITFQVVTLSKLARTGMRVKKINDTRLPTVDITYCLQDISAYFH